MITREVPLNYRPELFWRRAACTVESCIYTAIAQKLALIFMGYKFGVEVTYSSCLFESIEIFESPAKQGFRQSVDGSIGANGVAVAYYYL